MAGPVQAELNANPIAIIAAGGGRGYKSVVLLRELFATKYEAPGSCFAAGCRFAESQESGDERFFI